MVAAAPFGGAIALLRTDRRCRPGGEQIQVHSAAGQSIKKIRLAEGFEDTHCLMLFYVL